MEEPPAPAARNVLAPDCRRCPALVADRTRIAWGNGPLDADVVVVGEAPGRGDPDAARWRGGNHSGLAYTSRHSGRRARSLLAAVGYGGRAYYTNAVKCFPSDGEGSNREPTAEERTSCRGHLRAELEQVDPEWILATGRHATASLFSVGDRSLDSFLDRVLEPVRISGVPAPVIPLLHPSYQEVWLARIGYDEAEYRAELEGLLDGGAHRLEP